MYRFKNKVILVTGAASGIGEATTRRITSEGGTVVMADFAREKNELLAQELKAAQAEVFPVYFSAEDLESCRSLIEQTLDKYGRIDVLVNNVGGTDLQRDTDIGTLDITFFDQAFHLNLRSAICLSQLAIPAMLRQKGGNIVNIASIGGFTGDFRGTYYGTSKAALINLTRYIATQTGRHNIRCNAVAPGLVLTPAALKNLPEETRRTFERHNALPYLGEPQDIASAIAFLASEDARYITGQTLTADGGLTIHNPTIADFTNH